MNFYLFIFKHENPFFVSLSPHSGLPADPPWPLLCCLVLSLNCTSSCHPNTEQQPNTHIIIENQQHPNHTKSSFYCDKYITKSTSCSDSQSSNASDDNPSSDRQHIFNFYFLNNKSCNTHYQYSKQLRRKRQFDKLTDKTSWNFKPRKC